MRLEYRLPSPGFLSFLSVMGGIGGLAGPSRQLAPALLPNLHIRTAGQSHYRFAGREIRTAPAMALVGATSAAFAVELSADYEMVCAGFLPNGWRAMVGIPAAALADDMVDATLVWPPGAVRTLWHAVAEARGLAAQQALVERFLLARIPARQPGGVWQGAAVRSWLDRPGPLSPDGLAELLSLSPRQSARVAHDLCGAGPKTLAMKYRALRAAGTLAMKGGAALDQALADYADQSHMIRDFKRFLGCTPGQFVREEQTLTHTSLYGRWQVGARSSMVLLS